MRIRFTSIRRYFAYFIDLFIASIPALLIVFLLNMVAKEMMTNAWIFGGVYLIGMLIFYVIYEVYFLKDNKQSIGKKVTNLRVEFFEDSASKILVRSVVKAVSVVVIAPAVISFLMMNFGDPSTSLHDKIAGSRVLFS